jgi:hypothetical protein
VLNWFEGALIGGAIILFLLFCVFAANAFWCGTFARGGNPGRDAVIMAFVFLVIMIPKIHEGVTTVAHKHARARRDELQKTIELYKRERSLFPETLAGLVPKYLPKLPSLEIRKHSESARETPYGDEACKSGTLDPTKFKDTGTWGYVAAPSPSAGARSSSIAPTPR